MAQDMVVKNLYSTGKSVSPLRQYMAKIDGDGKFRVKDDSGRWSKYSPNMFEVLADPDSQMSRYGKPIEYSDGKGTVKMVSLTELADLERDLAAEARTLIDKRVAKTLLDETTFSTETPTDVDMEAVMKALEKLTGTPTSGIEKLLYGSATALGEAVHESARIAAAKAEAVPHYEKVKEHEKMKTSKTLREILVAQGVPEALVTQMNDYRKHFTDPDMPSEIKERIPRPVELYEGGELWTDCITAILAGKHILLSGGKATGKNTLTQSLAFAFQRPMWDMSFHSNIGKDEIIGSETFRDGNVVFNPGMAYMCAKYGGIGVLDEINMAKDNAISVLNSMLDDRRVIDVPGYDRLHLHRACTFIGTMNYGYAGTRALNEALASRFVIPNIREMTTDEIIKLLGKKFPNAIQSVLKYFAGVFTDLQSKAKSAEISTAAVDLRGIISALGMIEFGLSPNKAMVSNIVNKAFEEYERKIVKDVINTRIPTSWTSANVFTSPKAFVVDMSEVK